MGLLRIEGFDAFHQTNGASLNVGGAFTTKWTVDTGTLERVADGRDSVGKACALVNTGAITTPNFGTVEYPIIGFAIKVVALSGVGFALFPRFNSNFNRANLILNNDGTLSVRCNSTVVATTSEVINDGNWHYLEFKSKMVQTVGSYALRLDGSTVLSGSGIDMDGTGTSGCNNIYLAAIASGNEIHIDDFYFADAESGGEVTDFVGPCKVTSFVPDSDGTVAFTPSTGSDNFALVNEANPDGDTSYVETSSAVTDYYTLPDHDPNYLIFGLQINLYAKGSASGIQTKIDSGTVGTGSTESPTGSYGTFFTINETDPDTTDPWLIPALNASVFGFEATTGTPRVSRMDIDVLRSYDTTADPLDATAENTISLLDSAGVERPMVAKAGVFTANNVTGNQAISGLGFQPSVVVFFPSYSDFQDDPLSTVTEIGMSINMGAAAADDTQCAVSWKAISGSGNTETSRGFNRIANNRCIQTIDLNADAVWDASIVSLDSDGFTINWETVVASSVSVHGPHLFQVRYLALGGPAITEATIAEFDSEAAPGTQSYSVGFQPDAAIFISTPLTTSNTGDDAADPNGFGVGYVDNLKNQGANAISVWQEGSLGSGDVGAYSSWQQFGRAILQLQVNDLFSSGEGEPLSEAVLTDWEATGFELNWLTAEVAHKFFAICMKGGGYRVINGTEPSETGTQTLYTPRVKPVALMGQSMCWEDGNDGDPLTSWGVFTHGVTDGVSQSYMTVSGKPQTISNQQQVWDTTSMLRLATISTAASVINQRSRATISTLDENSFNLSWLVNFPDSRELIFMAFGEDHLGPVSATSTLDTLDQDIDVTSILNRATSSLLTMSDQARGPFPVSAVDTIGVTQSATRVADFNREALTTIVLTHEGGLVRVAADVIPIDDDVAYVLSKNIFDTIVLTDRADLPKITGDVLILLDSAKVPIHAKDRINLQDVAAIVPPPGALFSSSRLELTDVAIVLKNLHLFASNTIELRQAIAVLSSRTNCEWDGIDTPTGTLTKGIKLEGDTTVEISRSPNMGDIDRLAFDRIVRETRGGTLRVFADSTWSKVNTLVFTISGIRRTKSQEVLTFLLAHLGRDITLETHEGRRWLGVILNPGEVVIEDRRNSFTISIEFEGILQTS